MSNDQTIGLIETRGIVALAAGTEAMIKTADVTCVSIERVASGYFAVAIEGSLAAVRQALDAGKAAVQKHGEVRSSAIFPKPSDEALKHLDTSFRSRSSQVSP
jgi:ethanolamine utilization protein EutM